MITTTKLTIEEVHFDWIQCLSEAVMLLCASTIISGMVFFIIAIQTVHPGHIYLDTPLGRYICVLSVILGYILTCIAVHHRAHTPQDYTLDLYNYQYKVKRRIKIISQEKLRKVK